MEILSGEIIGHLKSFTPSRRDVHHGISGTGSSTPIRILVCCRQTCLSVSKSRGPHQLSRFRSNAVMPSASQGQAWFGPIRPLLTGPLLTDGTFIEHFLLAYERQLLKNSTLRLISPCALGTSSPSAETVRDNAGAPHVPSSNSVRMLLAPPSTAHGPQQKSWGDKGTGDKGTDGSTPEEMLAS
jgi:hypothetical protein